jgi:hypothetical protein
MSIANIYLDSVSTSERNTLDASDLRMAVLKTIAAFSNKLRVCKVITGVSQYKYRVVFATEEGIPAFDLVLTDNNRYAIKRNESVYSIFFDNADTYAASNKIPYLLRSCKKEGSRAYDNIGNVIAFAEFKYMNSMLRGMMHTCTEEYVKGRELHMNFKREAENRDIEALLRHFTGELSRDELSHDFAANIGNLMSKYSRAREAYLDVEAKVQATLGGERIHISYIPSYGYYVGTMNMGNFLNRSLYAIRENETHLLHKDYADAYTSSIPIRLYNSLDDIPSPFREEVMARLTMYRVYLDGKGIKNSHKDPANALPRYRGCSHQLGFCQVGNTMSYAEEHVHISLRRGITP